MKGRAQIAMRITYCIVVCLARPPWLLRHELEVRALVPSSGQPRSQHLRSSANTCADKHLSVAWAICGPL